MSVHRSTSSRHAGLTSALCLLVLAACDKDETKPAADSPRVALRAFSDCTDMRSYLTDVIVETLVQAQYGSYSDDKGGWGVEEDVDMGDADTGGAGGEEAPEAPDDYTGTNVQEQGVDEPDMVKTDGSYLYVAQNQELAVVQSWPAEDLALTGLMDLEGYPTGLFLHGDYAVVFSYDEDAPWDRTSSGTQLDLIDLSDRSNPEIVRSIQIEGDYAAARMIDGDVYVVLNSEIGIPDEAWDLLDSSEIDLPEVDWDAGALVYEMAADEARETLRPYVEAMVADWDLSEILPQYTDALAGEEAEPQVLHDCTDLYAPADTTRYGVLSIAHLDLGDDPTTGTLDAIGLLAEGWTVYASATNLYTATTSYYSWWGWDSLEITSDVHKFSLGGNVPVAYEASGRVPGWLPSQWAMSEYDGYLRLATTLPSDTETDEAGTRITVLSQTGESLDEVGSVGGIAEDETIYGARMMQDKGYVITYEQVDPLWTLDLSDPTNPIVAGQLEVLGYSSYLHPLDDDHLVAVGMAGDAWGGTTGVAVNLFDVSDLANPTLAQQYELASDADGWGYSEALWDHHAFTFDDGVLTIPAYTYDYSSGDYEYWSGAVVMDVDADAGISERGRVDHADLLDSSECIYDDYYEGYCDEYAYATLRRSVYIEDYLYTISDYGVKVGALATPETTVGTMVFHPAE